MVYNELMKLMTQYDWTMLVDKEGGKHITLVQLSDEKKIKFFIADPQVNEDRVASHMDSLTDTLCEQWFDEALTVEERKAKQKLRKEAARKEREEIERTVAAQKAAAALARKLEKEAEKARKAQRK